MGDAFGVSFRRVAVGGGSNRSVTGPVRMPPELVSIVEAVVGLDDRPYARLHN